MVVPRALKRAALAGASALLVSLPAASAPARWHFSFGGKWRISILFEREEGRGDTTRLLLDARAGRFVFVSSQDPSGRDSTESIRRLPDGETLTRRLVLSTFEEIPACSSVRPPDACVVLEGSERHARGGFSAFSDERARENARESCWLSPRPGCATHFSRSRPILPAVAEFGSYSKDFLGLIWPERFAKPQTLERGERTKGCDFDATFGYPCDAEARRREESRFGNGTH